MRSGKQQMQNLVFPTKEKIDEEALVKSIKEAEKGPFYTSSQVKQALKKWSKKYSR